MAVNWDEFEPVEQVDDEINWDDFEPVEEDAGIKSEIRAYEPDLIDRIKDYFPSNRARAMNEHFARQIAKEQGTSIENVYEAAGGYRPVLNPEGRPPIRAFTEGAEIVGEQLPDVPKAVQNVVLRQIRGGDFDQDRGRWIDEAIKETEVEEKPVDPNYQGLSGLANNLAYSFSTIGSYLLGLGAGTLASGGNPVVGNITGAAATTAAAFRGTKDQILEQWLDNLNKAYRAQYNRDMNKEEWEEAKDSLNTAANKYGAWEAIPEAVGNLIFVKTLARPLKSATGGMLKKAQAKASDIVGRLMATQMSEQSTELATSLGQNRVEYGIGVADEKLSPAQALRQNLVPVGLTTIGLGGAGAVASGVVNKVAGRKEPEIDQKPGQFTPTHIVAGGKQAQQVTVGGDPIKDTYIDEDGNLVRDPYAREYIPTPDEDGGLDAFAKAEKVRNQVMGKRGIVDSFVPQVPVGGEIDANVQAAIAEARASGITGYDEIQQFVNRKMAQDADTEQPQQEVEQPQEIEPDITGEIDQQVAQVIAEAKGKGITDPLQIRQYAINALAAAGTLNEDNAGAVVENINAVEESAPAQSEPVEQAEEFEKVTPAEEIDAAATEPATSPDNTLPEPTEAQKEAGNYKKGHIKVQGMDIAIENQAGSKRRPEWPKIKHHYGYIKRSIGADSDPDAPPQKREQVDVFVNPGKDIAEDTPIFIVDQYDPKTGLFDEHKVMVGFESEQEAMDAYRSNYTKDWTGGRYISQVSPDEFKAWLKDGDTTGPYSAKAQAEQKRRTGNVANIINPAGEDLKGRYMLVEASELVTSNDEDGNINKAYPKELQPRDRSRNASMVQVKKIANNIRPELLTESQKASEGAPVVGADNVVESGNGRVLAMRLAYQSGKAGSYLRHLRENAEKYGLTPEQVDAMNQPVLVRQRMDSPPMEQRAEFARQANQADMAPLSPTEQAAADAARLTDDDMAIYSPSDKGNVLAAKNDNFLRAFAKKIGDLETGGLSTKDGRWTKQMADRVQAAVFHKAYGDERLLALMAEEAETDIKNILSALNVAAPAFAKAKSYGDLGELDIISDIINAIDVVRDAKREGVSVKQITDQAGLFGDVDPLIARLAEFIEDNKRSSARLGEGLIGMAEFIETEMKNANQNDIFGEKNVGKGDIIESANRRMKEKYGEDTQIQTDIFGQKIEDEPQDNDRAAERRGGSREQEKGVRAETETADVDNVPRGTPSAKRFEAGKALSSEERKEVLRGITDVYVENGVQKVEKGVDSRGETIYGYPHSPEYFVKSDITGKMLRYYITLPDGRIAHPTELYPEIEQSSIDKEMLRREQEQKQEEAIKADYLRNAEEYMDESLAKASRKWRIGQRADINTESEVLYSEKENKYLRVHAGEIADRYLEVLKGRGFKRISDPAKQEKPKKKGKKKAKEKTYGSTNTLFTKDAAEQARAVLKAKLGQVSSGIDPEIMSAGITLAGYHIEAGARKFTEFSKAMIEDLGSGIKDYLKPLYMAVYHWPGMDTTGMTNPDKLTDELVEAAIDAAQAVAGEETQDTNLLQPELTIRPKIEPPNHPAFNITVKDGQAIVRIDIDKLDASAPNFGYPELTPVLDDSDPLLQDTKERYKASDNGEIEGVAEYQGERAALHEAIISKAKDDVEPSDKPVAYLMGGGGGAGKGTVLRVLKEKGIIKGNFVHIDPDQIKEQLPEYKQIQDTGDYRSAMVVHEESSDIGKILIHRAINERKPLIIDKTFGDFESGRKTIEALKAAGYEVRMIGVTTPVEDAMIRALERYYNTGRLPKPEDMIKAHAGFNAAFEKYAELVDKATMYDNTTEPVEIASFQGLDVVISNNEAYNKVDQRGKLNGQETTIEEIRQKTEAADGQGRISGVPSERAGGGSQEVQGRAANPDREQLSDDTPSSSDDSGADTRTVPREGQADGAIGGNGEGSGGVSGGNAAAGAGTRPGGKKGKRGRTSRSGANGARTGIRNRRGDSTGADTGRSGSDLQPRNYRITESDQLGKGGALEKARANIQAIRIIKTLQQDGRPATAEEQAALVKYVGWGDTSIKNKLFPAKGEPEGSWKTLHDELRELLTEDELKTAARSVQYAHYTSKPVIDGIYAAIERFGLKKGMAIEGGAGIGHFLGLIPQSMNIHYTGVEMDIISGQIARALYPDSGMRIGDFTKIALPENHFDLSIGNPPFASVTVLNDAKYRKHKFQLHDYFIAKQIDAVKPGGIAVFVTSKGTMDKVSDDARKYLSERANLIGAVRLPQTAFKENAGTEVVTDILFFQKKGGSNEIEGEAWTDTQKIKIGDGEARINEYFVNHPEMVLGKHALTGSMYRSDEYTVEPTGDIVEQLNRAIGMMPEGIYQDHVTDEELDSKVAEYDLAPEQTESSYYIDSNDNLRQVIDGVGQIVPVRGGKQRTGKSKVQAQQLRDYIKLRDAVMATYRAMAIGEGVEAAQKVMTKAYNAFVKAHGPINQVKIIKRKDGKEISQEPIISNIQNDPEAYRVAAIERYDEATGKAAKGDIFTENIIARLSEPRIESAIDALSVTLNDRGYVDMDYLQEIYPGELEDILSELDTAVWLDPQSGRYVTEDEYLSGNVKAKLEEARRAAEDDKQFEKNVKALEAVQPEDVDISKIPTNMGNHWMEPWVMERFAEQELGFTGKITHFVRGDTSRWIVNGRTRDDKYSTAARKSYEILEAALNSATIKVYKTVYIDGKQKKELDTDETTAANQKVQELKNRFKLWVREDIEVTEYVHRRYNELFNTDVKRQFNGEHLRLPGLSKRFQPKIIDGKKRAGMHPWVRNVVWRILQRGNTYMAHTVGAGKTLASITAAMELRRLGLAKRPTFAVLKSTLKQFAAEFYEAYPNAKVLIADENQLDAKNRRRFLARMANEEWDAIIMTHQAFQNISLSDETVKAMVEHDLAEYRDLLEEIDEEDRATRSQIERQIERMEQQLESKSDQSDKDAGLTFEEIGIDFVFVDEAHTHKKIPFPTSQTNIKGIDSNGSAIAYDLYMKSRYMNSVNPGRNLVLMSGTPVTNTLGEVFNIQRYLQPDVLERKGISSFDSWAATFAETVTDIEMQPNGKYKPVTRMSRFVGVPGLLRDFLQVADIITDDDLNKSLTIKRPSVVGGQRQIEVVPRSEELANYQKQLDARIKALENKKGPPKKGEDNILVVITDAKKASIDMRLVGGKQKTPSKLDRLIDDAYAFWKRTSDVEYYKGGKKELKKGSTQLIFTEIRQAAGFDIYEYIKEELVKRGVPAREIAFIQDFGNSTKKKKLFKDMNTGVKRILIGGSKNLGTGTNVQQRLGRISHLDIDWLPANIIQREGRGIRQGNKNSEIEIVAYATEGTVDSTMWQMNERKQNMIDQIMSGDLSVDSVEDVSNQASQMAMAKALSSGNPLLLEQAGLEGEVQKLESMQTAHISKQMQARQSAARIEQTLEQAREQLPALKAFAENYQPTTGDKFAVEVDGKTYKDRKKAGEAILKIASKMRGVIPQQVGRIGNAEIRIKPSDLVDARVELRAEGISSDIRDAVGVQVVDLDFRIAPEDSAVGVVRKIENMAAKIASAAEDVEQSMEVAEKELKAKEEMMDAKFQYTAELEEKRARLKEINEILEREGREETDETPEPSPLHSKVSVSEKKPAARMARSRVEYIVDEFKKRYKGTEDLNIYIADTQGEIFSDSGERIKGAFFANTNDVVLIVENLNGDKDTLRTLQHEIVAHYGLRRLLNRDGEYDALLARVHAARNGELKSLYEQVSREYEGADKWELAEEVLAKAQEQKGKSSLVQRLYAQVVKLMHKFGLARGPVSRREVNALLYLSARRLRQKPRNEKTADARRSEPLFAKASRESMPTEGNLGMPEERATDMFVRWFQDSFNRVKALQAYIRKTGGVVTNESDVYQAEELSSGKITARLTNLEKRYMKPLVDIMSRENITLDELDDFLIARHAPERNAYIASINPDMPDGGSGMTTAEAEAYMRSLPKERRQVLETAAEYIYAVNRQQLSDLVAGGHLKQEVVDEWVERWDYYVPLKGIAEEQSIRGTGAGYSVIGAGIKAAFGRGAGNRAESPTAHSFAQAENAIVRTEKTKVGQALVQLIRDNPDPELWTISKRTFKRFVDLYGEPFEGYEEEPVGLIEGIDYHRVKAITKAERELAEREGRDPVAKVVYRLDPGYRYREDVFGVMVEGEELLINIKDKVLAEQLKRMNVSQMNALVAGVAQLNRYLAMVNTALNPEFVVTNFMRDFETSLVHLAGEHSAGIAAEVARAIPSAIRGIWQETFDTKGNSEWRKVFNEMRQEGGTIGFFGLEDIEARKNRIQSKLDMKQTLLGKAKRGVFTARDVVLDANLSVENAARLAAYKVVRDRLIANGYAAAEAKAKAASIAKNLTVNFNRKGEFSPLMNSLYLFYNASIQGTARIFLALGHPRVQKIVAGTALTAFALAMYNRNAGGDDDDGIPLWDKTPEHVKQTSIVIMRPDGSGKYWSFRLPYGYNVFYYTGIALHDLMFNPRKTAIKTALDMASAMLNAFNPIQGADLVDTITPTVAKPIEQHYRNIDFASRKIVPEYPFDQYDRPESEKYRKSTNPELVEFMQWLNEVTGGDATHPGAIDISPEIIKHYVGWVTGGAGMTVMRTIDSTINAVKGNEVETRNIPFVRTLAGKVGSGYDYERYYEAQRQVEAVKAMLRKLKGTDAWGDYKAENNEVYKLSLKSTGYKKKISELRDKRDQAYRDEDYDLANDYKEQIRQKMMEFSMLYDEAVELQQ